MGKIATEQEGYAKGMDTFLRFTTKINKTKLLTENHANAFGLTGGVKYKSNQCVQYDDLRTAGTQLDDDAWIWYLQITPDMIYWWNFGTSLSGDGSNYNNFKKRVKGTGSIGLQCMGSYICNQSELQSQSSIPFNNVHNDSKPFDLSTGALVGECIILDIRTSCSDDSLFIAGFGGHGNENGICRFTWLQRNNSTQEIAKAPHYVNIRKSDGQMDDNFLSDDLLMFFRFSTTFVSGYSGFGEEFSTVVIPINSTKVSIMSYAEYKRNIESGNIKNVSAVADSSKGIPGMYGDEWTIFPPSISK
ncbi:hypothetical protein PC1C4_05730 [Paraprevotella clara]|uniref:hypothetical protein n=1 Tax=Paraprevotella clara TaxID=454154 RepID=UPI002490CD25|nr:hypothetical protein [Paraprevotella clara]BDI73851.1 hypothetical protein PC1C4_05730 [Paraprevotella clara]